MPFPFALAFQSRHAESGPANAFALMFSFVELLRDGKCRRCLKYLQSAGELSTIWRCVRLATLLMLVC